MKLKIYFTNLILNEKILYKYIFILIIIIYYTTLQLYTFLNINFIEIIMTLFYIIFFFFCIENNFYIILFYRDIMINK